MKKSKIKLLVLLVAALFLFTGCTTYMLDGEKKNLKNPTTGQQLPKNILCKPTDEEVLNLYRENAKYDYNEIDGKVMNVDELVSCDEFTPVSGGYEGLWNSLFVKPLAFVILLFEKLVGNSGFALIITSLLIRLIAYPITRKTAIQSELIKEAKPELDRIEKKYQDKTDNESMLRKSQELSMVYKKHNINPMSSCLFALIQIPLFIGFLEAINRVPAIFEQNFLGFQLGTTPGTAIMSGNYLYLLLIALVGLSTYFSMFLNSASNTDTQQFKTMNTIMVVMITVMGVVMTSALNIYWITTNIFTIIQNLIVKKRKKVA